MVAVCRRRGDRPVAKFQKTANPGHKKFQNFEKMLVVCGETVGRTALSRMPGFRKTV